MLQIEGHTTTEERREEERRREERCSVAILAQVRIVWLEPALALPLWGFRAPIKQLRHIVDGALQVP